MEEEGLSSASSGSETRLLSAPSIAAAGKRKRKKYVLTKRREYWTEEEHARFVRALGVYGREWKLIEQEVGTKTAVQIRSHAQKYFLRVERMKSSARGSATTSLCSKSASTDSIHSIVEETEKIEDVAHTLLSMKNAFSMHPQLPIHQQSQPRFTVCTDCPLDSTSPHFYSNSRASVFY